MNPERWKKVEEIYHAVLSRPPQERARFLSEISLEDDELRREVESLLAYDDRARDFLETSAMGETVRMVAGEATAEGERTLLRLLFESGAEEEEVAPELRVTTPDGRLRSVRLEGSTISLGRAPHNDLSFPEDDGLSREHMVFEWEGDHWTIRDLDSKNGTAVNGNPLQGKRRLEPGDRVSASCITITYTTSPVE